MCPHAFYLFIKALSKSSKEHAIIFVDDVINPCHGVTSKCQKECARTLVTMFDEFPT